MRQQEANGGVELQANETREENKQEAVLTLREVAQTWRLTLLDPRLSPR
jgi:hypothetical protein